MSIQLFRIDQLQEGDLVDLEKDPFADPKGDHPQFEDELYKVVDITVETPNCIAIAFEGFDIVGFPPDHLVKVRRV